MNIQSPSHQLLNPVSREEGIALLRHIEDAARISHRTEHLMTEETWASFIRRVVLEHGDWSVVEHAHASVLFYVNRGITHELVRHRLFGFTQESTRFVNYSKKDFEAVYIPSTKVRAEDTEEWSGDLAIIDAIYRKWLGRTYAPQIARDFLPNALGAKILITGNLRNWRHFLLMRTTVETHPDCRVVSLPLLEEFKDRVPILFDDIQPESRQIDNLRKPR